MVGMTAIAPRQPPVLVLISGLQGTGKSTLAAAVAAALDAEQTMLAAETLAEGRNVVVECDGTRAASGLGSGRGSTGRNLHRG